MSQIACITNPCLGAEVVPEPGFVSAPADSTSVYHPPIVPDNGVIKTNEGNKVISNSPVQFPGLTTVEEEQPEKKRYILPWVIGGAIALSLLT